MPVYVQAYHAKVAKSGERLEISIDDVKTESIRLIDCSQLALFGNVYLTSPALTELMSRNIPVIYHQPRYGRPALSLDLMETFRPLIADSSVIQAINNGEVKPTYFVQVAGSVNITNDGRKRFIGTFERRTSMEATHPTFG